MITYSNEAHRAMSALNRLPLLPSLAVVLFGIVALWSLLILVIDKPQRTSDQALCAALREASEAYTSTSYPTNPGAVRNYVDLAGRHSNESVRYEADNLSRKINSGVDIAYFYSNTQQVRAMCRAK